MKTLNEISVEEFLHDHAAMETKSGPVRDGRNPFALELEFTEVYRRNHEAHPAIRETRCLRVLFPAILRPIQPADLLAGRIRYPLVGFSPEPGGLGYYCREGDILRAMETLALPDSQSRDVRAMCAFWRTETTAHKTRAACPAWVNAVLASDNWTQDSGMAFPLYRMAGVTLDFGKLLQLGIPGLRTSIHTRRAQEHDEAKQALFSAMLSALDVLVVALQHYAGAARTLAAHSADPHAAASLSALAETLATLPDHAPRSFRDAVQLMWLYVMLSGTWNYGRMDTYLGPFLCRDLDAGTLSEPAALAILQSLWRLMKAYDNQYNNRVFIGGLGRSDEAAADRFALLALEASRTVLENQPQLSLRFYRGQNPTLFGKALTVLAEGRTFPMLYNDDVNVPAVAKAFNVPLEEAVEYTPFGCGEYALAHRSVGSPNGVINLTKCLEIALHNGRDPLTGQLLGPATGAPQSFVSIEQVFSAYQSQVQRCLEALAVQERTEYDVTGREASFLLFSMLYDDCLARGQSIFAGGVRYLGGTIETYGNTNAADSLTAIDAVVFRRKLCTLPELVAACDANFQGHADLRQALLQAPKYGNDDAAADAMAQRVHTHVCHTARDQAGKAGLHSYLVVIINNWANVIFGKTTSASADGRLATTPLANANNPTSGMDRQGATAFLNSLVKLDPTIHAGAVQNMKFAKSLFTTQRPKLEALLHVYFAQGGTQAMITVVNRADMEAAMRAPEQWGHLMVRVGGFSARFIDLPRDVQVELLARTLHE